MKKVILILCALGFFVMAGIMVRDQQYIYFYNEGVVAYDNRDYEAAAVSFHRALGCALKEGQECDVCVNLALSMVAPYDFNNLKNLSKSEIRSLKRVLKDAISILCADGCAKESGHGGHDREAQQLQKELQEILDMLEQDSSQGQDPDGGDGGEDGDTPPEDTPPVESDIPDGGYEPNFGDEEHQQEMTDWEALENWDYYEGYTW